MREIVIATKNPDKKKELAKLLKGLRIKVTSLDKYPDAPDAKEGKKCFVENAILKAMSASRFTKKLAIADDSGLEVDALDGAPGVTSARFAGPNVAYGDNNKKLLRMLKEKTLKERGAQFRCIAAICDYPKVIAVVEGKVRGKIACELRGKNGFGYDPLFIIPRLKKTFAEITLSAKNKISHRGLALKKAKKEILKYFKSNF